MPGSPDWTNVEQNILQTYQSQTESPEELFAQVYNELRQVAQAYMRRECPDHTLQATALVHEAYMRLFEDQALYWENKKHLFCTVARCMRRILVDHARRHRSQRQGGEHRKVSLDEQGPAICRDLPQLIALGEALDRLGQLNPRQAQVVELHSFAGLTEDEVAEVLGVSIKTIMFDDDEFDWRF